MIQPARHTARRRRLRRSGFSLLEVILAIALLAAALAAIGELVRIGMRSSATASELTSAQFIGESKLAEITAGILPPQAIGPLQSETDPDWLYSVAFEPTEQDGLVAVRVIVQRNVDPAQRPTTYMLVRWIRDPGIVIEEETEQSTTTSE